MKKTKTIKKMAIASLFGTAVLAVFSACGGGNSALNELEAPKNLRLENEYLCWDNIEGAEEYLVEINGEEYTSKDNKFDIFYITDHNQRYDMRVMAYGDMESTSDSNWSDFFIYDVDSNNGGWEFKYNKDKTECTVTVTDKDKIKGKMIVPEDDGSGVPVTKIDNFSFCKNLTSIILPDTLYVTQVAGGYFFWGCESLERVKLPDRMDKISGVAFNDCKSLYEIDIPESIQIIEGSLFSGCTSLKEVTFHDGLKALGLKMANYCIEYLFDYNNNEYLSLSPNSEGIFEGCKSLTKIVVPKTVESITANMFRGVNCEIEIDEENPYFYYDGGYLIRRDGNEIIYAKDKTQPIPSYVRKIGDFVFYNSEMSELAVPEFIESIGDCAFAYCQNLKKVILPNGLKNLGASAFACCDKLEELNIPSGITRIENAMFTGCNSLNINIQLHITEIREQAFCHLEKPITLSKDVAITGPDVFKCATIYTSNDSVNNDKWHRVENGKYSTYWQRDCNIFICCDLREDGDSEYVYSWKPYSKQEMHTWIKNEEGETIEEVKTYYTGNVTFRDKAAFLNPSRRGYTFKGWTTKEGSDTVEYQLYISRVERELLDGTVVYSLRLSIEQNKYVQLPEDTAMLYAVWEKN